MSFTFRMVKNILVTNCTHSYNISLAPKNKTHVVAPNVLYRSINGWQNGAAADLHAFICDSVARSSTQAPEAYFF